MAQPISSFISPIHLAPALARLSRWAVWAALTEFLLLRIAIRFGPVLPPTPTVTQAAQVVLLAGTVALNVAAILSTLAIMVMAGLTRSLMLRALLIAAAGAGLIRVTLPHGATPILDAVFLLYSVVALAAMVLALGHSEPRSGEESLSRPTETLRRVMLIIVTFIYAALAYPAILATVARLGWTWAAGDGTVIPHFIAEGLAVLVALMVYFAYRPARSTLGLAGSLIATALLGGFWMARPHLASALTQWTVDFATFLPPWLYLLGLFGFLYTAIALVTPFSLTGRRAEDEGQLHSRFAAWGLILIALGGLRWDYTYFSGLGLLGFLLLAERSWANGKT